MLVRFSLLWLLLLPSTHAHGQAVDTQQIQAVVDGQLTGTTARSIADHLSSRPGVLLCRVDVGSRNVLLHVDPTCRLSQQAIEHFFSIHGLHLRCYVRAPRTNAPFRLLDPATCAPLQPTK